MTPERELELRAILEYSRKYNIWGNPKRPDVTDTCNCEYCGKKCGGSPLQVHITYEGTCLPNDVTRDEINEIEQSQGCWNIGNSCAKKLFGKDIDKYTK
jgi:hypothetical protein